MSEESTTAIKTDEHPVIENGSKGQPAEAKASNDYTLPIVHLRVPAKAVDVGFWGGLAGAVVLGVVDPPLGLLVGAGVVVARHRSKQ